MELKKRNIAIQYEQVMEAQDWLSKIPELQFPKEWRIKIVPPFGGAIIRFFVDDCVSVYLDGYNALGFESQPYREIYSDELNTERFYINETKELIEGIQKHLNAK